MNQLVPADQTSTREIGIVAGAGGSSIAPQNLGEVVRFAEVMCRADIALPKHLRGNAGACMAVALQALQWEMNPFAVASKSYSVNGIIAYEAQLIAAVVNTRSGIKGRLKYEYFDEGEAMWCRVSGTLDDEVCTYDSPPVSAITPKNSPLWKTDQRQQLGYYSARSWARRHCPEVLLGIYDRDEASSIGPENARDVTPSVMQRLQARQEAPQTREGFDQSFVTRETAALTGEADSNQTEANSQSSDTPSPSDEGSVETSPTPSPAADYSEPADAADQEEDAQASETSKPADGQSVASSSDLSDEDRAWLKVIAKMLWAATGVGDQDILSRQFAGAREHQTPDTISKAARDRGNAIYQKLKMVCFGEKDSAEALTEIAMSACCDPKEIV